MLARLDTPSFARGGSNHRVRASRWDGTTIPPTVAPLEAQIALLTQWIETRRAMVARDCAAERGAILAINKRLARGVVGLAMLAKYRDVALPETEDAELAAMVTQALARLRTPKKTDTLTDEERDAWVISGWRRQMGVPDRE